MTKYIVDGEELTDVADAIREKTSTTELMTLPQMAANILAMTAESGGESGGGSGLTNGNFYTEMVQKADTTTNGYAALLTGNEFARTYWNNPTFFIVLFGLQVPVSPNVSSRHQWVTACACNSPVIQSSDSSESWYGFGVYHWGYDGYSYPSTGYIVYSNVDTPNQYQSGFHVTENGDVSMYLSAYDELAPGVYRVLLGTLM